MDGTIALMLIEALLILLALSVSKAIRFISPLLYGNQPAVVHDSSKDDVILTQTVSPPATKYDVFLNFRGEDTRHSFASYLYKGLRKAGIHTFMDHELCKGEQISPVLLRKIEESEIHVIIFSENYASSKWCMDELVHILECKKKFGRIAIPIFYNVHPSNIRKQNGSFGHGFDIMKQRFKDNQEKLQRWRNALIQSTSLSGWDSNGIRPEFKLVEEIVKDILSKLNYKSSSRLERLIGIASHIENIEKLLTEARIVGIWGMGGVGKTTLAKAIFQELKAQFDAFSFIENVKEQLARISLDELQKNCLNELLKDEDISIYDIKSTFVKSRLRRKKILLILDDVDNSIIAEDLAELCDWFGEGSRIIITSRNEQVLKNAYAFARYHVPNLDFHDAFHLFNLKAFKQYEPLKGYKELSISVVDYCQGHPLSLVVLGCFLHGREKEEWESALEKLNHAPPKDIIDVLKVSFDGLDDKLQNLFLDLAFLFMERVYHESLDLIRQLCDSSMQIEMSILRERSLISVSNNGKIEMHDLVRKMGLEIARQQLISNLKIPVRLWRHEDIYDFLICDKGIEAIRIMLLDTSKIKRITMRANNFRKMHNLIFLKVYKSDRGKLSKLDVCEDLDYLSEQLKIFSWEEYPLPYIPLHFCAENLVILNMPNSNIQQLWNGDQHFPNLELILLWYSKHLIALPNFSHTPKIKFMSLDGCVNLAQIHSSTVPRKNVQLGIEDSGPVQINFGGTIKGTNSGLVIVHNYLDLDKLSFNKVIMKLFVSGKVISGVRFKHMVIPLVEIAELRLGTQSLASLLPFVRKVDWLESPIEFGDDFKQHYTYHLDYAFYYHRLGPHFRLDMKVRDDRGERGVEGPLRREMVDNNEREMINDDQVATMTLMEVEEEDYELLEYCCSSKSATLTTLPNSITRWSLLRQLRLNKSDIIGNAGCGIDQVSILKTLSLSHDSCKRIQSHLDVKLSFDDIPPSASLDHDLYIPYNLVGMNQQRDHRFPGSLYYRREVINYGSLGSNYDSLVVTFQIWEEKLLINSIYRKQG